MGKDESTSLLELQQMAACFPCKYITLLFAHHVLTPNILHFFGEGGGLQDKITAIVM